jgi:uncharacterized protein involved in exopolysaccharide biosynthesis
MEVPVKVNGEAGSEHSPASSAPEEHSLLELLSVLLRYRWMLVCIPLALGALLALTAFLKPVSYTSTASLIPEAPASNSGGRLAGLAAQFGMGVGGGSSTTDSPDFYVWLLSSRGILTELLASEFSYVEDGESVKGRLIDLLPVDENSPARREEAAIRELRDRIRSGRSFETGVVTVSVTMPSPHLATQIAQRLLDLTAEFNVRTRQSRAGSERTFAGERAAEAATALRAAEDGLQGFLQVNRQFERSPGLVFQRERLQREVVMRQEVYTSLLQSYEQARIDEVRDTPVLTVVDAPQTPAIRDPRGTAMRALLGLGFGAMVAVALALLLDYLRRSRELGRPEYREFTALRQTAFRWARRRDQAAHE